MSREYTAFAQGSLRNPQAMYGYATSFNVVNEVAQRA